MRFKVTLLLTLALALSACEETVRSKDGTIPAEYLSYAQHYLGLYQGQFDGVNGQLEISLNGNKPVVIFTDEFGGNDLVSRCQSSIDQLHSVDVRVNKDKQIELVSAIRFRFYPGKCRGWIAGRDLTLFFSENTNKSSGEMVLTAQVLQWSLNEHYESVPRNYCGKNCSDDHRPGAYNHYLTGTFSRN